MNRRLFDDTPTHLVDPSDAKRTRCGRRLNGKDGSPFPYVGAEHAQRHIEGRSMVICRECAA